MQASEIERLLRAAFPDAVIDLKDLRGDGEAYAARVESAAFAGVSRLDQHRMVFAALEGRVGATLPYFSLRTLVPEAEDA